MFEGWKWKNAHLFGYSSNNSIKLKYHTNGTVRIEMGKKWGSLHWECKREGAINTSIRMMRASRIPETFSRRHLFLAMIFCIFPKNFFCGLRWCFSYSWALLHILAASVHICSFSNRRQARWKDQLLRLGQFSRLTQLGKFCWETGISHVNAKQWFTWSNTPFQRCCRFTSKNRRWNPVRVIASRSPHCLNWRGLGCWSILHAPINTTLSISF